MKMKLPVTEVSKNYLLFDGLLDEIKISSDRRNVSVSLTAIPVSESHPAGKHIGLVRSRNVYADSDLRNLVLSFTGCKDIAVLINGESSSDLTFTFSLSNGMEKFDLTSANGVSWCADFRAEEVHCSFEFEDVEVDEA